MTCTHGCRRCERSRDIQTLTWVVVGSIIVGAAIQYWYVSVPILGVVLIVAVAVHCGHRVVNR